MCRQKTFLVVAFFLIVSAVLESYDTVFFVNVVARWRKYGKLGVCPVVFALLHQHTLKKRFSLSMAAVLGKGRGMRA